MHDRDIKDASYERGQNFPNLNAVSHCRMSRGCTFAYMYIEAIMRNSSIDRQVRHSTLKCKRTMSDLWSRKASILKNNLLLESRLGLVNLFIVYLKIETTLHVNKLNMIDRCTCLTTNFTWLSDVIAIALA